MRRARVDNASGQARLLASTRRACADNASGVGVDRGLPPCAARDRAFRSVGPSKPGKNVKGKGKTHDGMPKDSFKYVGYPDTAPLVVDMFTETAKMKQCMGVKGGAAEHSPEAWGVLESEVALHLHACASGQHPQGPAGTTPTPRSRSGHMTVHTTTPCGLELLRLDLRDHGPSPRAPRRWARSWCRASGGLTRSNSQPFGK